MIGIKAISSYIPLGKLDNFAQARKFGETENFIKNKIGSSSLPHISEGEETSDMAVHAVKNLIHQHNLPLEEIGALVVVTQNGDGSGLPHTAAIVQAKLGLDNQVATFDISLGCSGYVYGLSILKGLMEQVGLKNAVLITADPYSKIIDRNDRVTTLLFGDAATATWLSHDGNWKFLKPQLETDGSGACNLIVKNGHLVMNGRQVFNFAVKKVPEQIKKCLDQNNIRAEDIDVYCLHQGSASIIEAIAKRFPNIKDRFINNIEGTGNTVSSSIPLLLEKEINNQRLERILISGFGVGLSSATNILYKEI